jgi:hypothetical protein
MLSHARIMSLAGILALAGLSGSARGDAVVCVVEPAPGDPGVPRLSLELLTPPQLAAPGDVRVGTNVRTILPFDTADPNCQPPAGSVIEGVKVRFGGIIDQDIDLGVSIFPGTYPPALEPSDFNFTPSFHFYIPDLVGPDQGLLGVVISNPVTWITTYTFNWSGDVYDPWLGADRGVAYTIIRTVDDLNEIDVSNFALEFDARFDLANPVGPGQTFVGLAAMPEIATETLHIDWTTAELEIAFDAAAVPEPATAALALRRGARG